MRVLLVSYRFPPDTVGGVERYTESLACELVKAGHQAAVVARRTESGKANVRMIRERLQDNTLLYRVIGPDIRFDRFLDNHRRFDQLFTMAALETKPDIVHINHIMGFSPRIVRIAHRLGAAVVVSLHDFYFACPRIHLRKITGELCKGPEFGRECHRSCFSHQPEHGAAWGLRAMYFQRTLASAQALIAYSDYVAGYFKSLVPGIGSIRVLPNGVPTQYGFDDFPVPPRDGRLTLAYCGTVAAHKGPHLILEALRIARMPATVLLIGHAPEKDYVRKLRDLAAATPGVDLKCYGRYERSEMPHLLRGVACVVMPSLVPEAGPIVPRESLACGVPVLAARIGALPEVIVDGENGFTFDPTRPAELAVILQRIAADQRCSAG